MQSTLTPEQSDDPHDVLVVAPDAVRVAPSDEELSNLLQQAAQYRSDTQAHAASDFPAGPTVPPVDTTFRPAAVDDLLAPGQGWSMARRAVRACMALLLAACVGIATFAWRAYGDTVEKKIAKWTTQLVLTSSLPPEKPGPVAQPSAPAVQAEAANPSPISAPPAQSASEAVVPAAAAPPAESAQMLQSMARDLASQAQEVEQLKASIEQLKAGQQQMSRDIARVSEQNTRPRISALAPPPAVTRPRKPAQPSFPPAHAAVIPAPQAAAPYVPRQIEPQRQPTAETLTDPELSSVPRPPMPVRPGIGSFAPQ